jgi:DNA-binding NarL/FixJ family response regulator
VIRVAVIEDQALLRGGIRAILEDEPDIEVVGEADNGADGVELTVNKHPDVVLMDIRLPRLDGIEATRRLIRAGSRAKILMLTTFDHDEYVLEALRAGAAGFLLKSFSPERLIEAVRTVADGDALLAPTITRRLIEQLLAQPTRADAMSQYFADLTERELVILRHLARGMSNAAIAAELVLSEATVKSHVTRLLQKLGLRSRVQAVVLAYETGLVRPGENGLADEPLLD